MDKKIVQEYYNQRWKNRDAENNDRIGWAYEKCIIDSTIIKKLRDFNPKKILEVGIGKGDLAKKISKCHDMDFKEYVGIDLSNEGVKIASKNVDDQRFSFKMFDCTNMPFKSQFDLIIFSEVLEHVENKNKAINEIEKSLVPGVILILTTPNPNALIYLIPKKLNWNQKTNYGSSQIVNDLIEKESLLHALKKSNFEIKGYKGLILKSYFVSMIENKLNRPILRSLFEYLGNKEFSSKYNLYQMVIAKKCGKKKEKTA